MKSLNKKINTMSTIEGENRNKANQSPYEIPGSFKTLESPKSNMHIRNLLILAFSSSVLNFCLPVPIIFVV